MTEHNSSRPDVVLLAGPTASGKSALAVELATQFGADVVNADSMQVYAELQVLSARPTLEDMHGVPHHLFGHVPGREQYDTARWLADVATLMAERKPLVLVGGTGLYFSALERGLSELPQIPDDVRARVRARFSELGAEGAHSWLKDVDPLAAERLDRNDSQRIQRALEVFEATGRSMFDQPQPAPESLLLHGLNVRRIVLEPPRAVLHQRISARFDGMVRAGALAEVSALNEMDLPEDRTILKAIGVPEFRAHLAGEISIDQAVTNAKTATRRYAKRQSTWFRNQMDASWQRIEQTHQAYLAQ
ncbi:MAG: tRNA (adenosine(37)-N6)-dimethylallyltransferase MiaA [Pseudomonadota bacterium]